MHCSNTNAIKEVLNLLSGLPHRIGNTCHHLFLLHLKVCLVYGGFQLGWQRPISGNLWLGYNTVPLEVAEELAFHCG